MMTYFLLKKDLVTENNVTLTTLTFQQVVNAGATATVLDENGNDMTVDKFNVFFDGEHDFVRLHIYENTLWMMTNYSNKDVLVTLRASCCDMVRYTNETLPPFHMTVYCSSNPNGATDNVTNKFGSYVISSEFDVSFYPNQDTNGLTLFALPGGSYWVVTNNTTHHKKLKLLAVRK
jgi:hypothetical protein